MFPSPNLGGRGGISLGGKPEQPALNYLDSLIQTACSLLREQGSVNSIFFMEKEGHVQPFPIPGEFMGKKDLLANILRGLVDANRPNSHVLIVEAWLHKRPVSEADPPELDTLPTADLATSKDVITVEALCFHVSTKLGSETQRWLGTMEFSRDSDNKVDHIAPVAWVLDGANGVKIGGRFFD